MGELRIRTESKPKRCEICHQADVFEQEKELCLRCVKINTNISKNNLKSDLAGKNELHLVSKGVNPIHLGRFALIITLAAHLPLLCFATLSPPSYSITAFFLAEVFITCFTVRWKKEVAQGVFVAIVLSTIVFIMLLKFNPFNPLVSNYVSRH